MMAKYILLLSVLGIFLVISCQRNLEFFDLEKSLLNMYNKGDTLIFKSSKGTTDTSFIVRKDIGYAAWNPLAHSGNYRVLVGSIYYGSKSREQDNMFLYKILSVGKSDPDTTHVYISYKESDASWNFNKFSINSLEKYKVEDGRYRFKISRQVRGTVSETQLFFDLKYGVVRYVDTNG